MAEAPVRGQALAGSPATHKETRRYRKKRLAAAFRLCARFGCDEGVAGHITVGTRSVRPDSGESSGRRDGRRATGEPTAFAIHSCVHAVRPDVIATAHSHSLHGKAWSSFARLLDPITQDFCVFYEDDAVFNDYTSVVCETSEGDRIAQAVRGSR